MMYKALLIVILSSTTLLAQTQAPTANMVCPDKFTFGYTPSLYTPDTTLYVHHRDVVGTWFVAPASGTIDSVFVQIGDSIGAADSTIYFRIHQSNVGPTSGPGHGYPAPPVQWGYWVNSNDCDQQLAAFKEEATVPGHPWVSTVTGSSTPSFAPFGNELWGFGGFPKPIHPNTAEYVATADLSMLTVAQGDKFFISMRVADAGGPNCGHINEPATGFAATSRTDQTGSHLWIFSEHNRGWSAVAGANLNVWFVMSATSNVPPIIQDVSYSISDAHGIVRATIGDCDPSNPSMAEVAEAFTFYSIDGNLYDSIPMSHASDWDWACTIPGATGYSLFYFVRAKDVLGRYSDSPIYKYTDPMVARVTGEVFNDLNRNGSRDAYEPTPAGQQVKVRGSAVDSSVTRSNGKYQLNLLPGDYNVSLDVRPGWTQTFPASLGTYDVHVDSGDVVKSINFGARNQYEVLTDLAISDNGNIRDTLRFGTVSGATSSLDASFGEIELPITPPSGSFDIRWSISGSEGSKRDLRSPLNFGQLQNAYVVAFQPGPSGFPMTIRWKPSNLPVGSMRIRDWLTAGGIYNVNMKQESVLVITNTNIKKLEIINGFSPSSVSGEVFNDLNGDGIKTPNESGYPAATVRLLLDGKELVSTQTNAAGSFSFTGLGPGSYTISQDVPAQWYKTTGDVASFSLGEASSKIGISIGLYHLGGVFGDVFQDKNLSFQKDPTDSLLAGWKVLLQGPINDSLITNSSGRYQFLNLVKGSYTLRVEQRAGWGRVLPMDSVVYHFTIDTSGSSFSGRDFGVIYYSLLEFISSIIVADHGANFDTLKFGKKFGATGGIDPSVGEYELGGDPMPNVFDVRWSIPGTRGSRADYRSIFYTNTGLITYRALVRPGSGGYPIVVRWNEFDYFGQSWVIRDDSTHGKIFSKAMDSDNLLIISDSKIRSFEIVNRSKVIVPFSVHDRWNIVSLPALLSDNAKVALFPTATSPAYAFNDFYKIEDTLIQGKGYWLRFPQAMTMNLIGFSVPSETVAVSTGWNLIGSLSANLSVSSIRSIPSGIVASNAFEYDKGYVASDALTPGKGYWIKAAQPGQLILSNEALFSKAADSKWPQSLSGFPTLKITDSEGDSRLLFVDRKDYLPIELPPLPPAGVFDARFSSEFVEANAANRLPISITSAQYPVVLSWNPGDENVQANLSIDGVDHPIGATSSVRLAKPASNLTLVVGGHGGLPQDYALHQNYPNPFNPSTTIRYQIPSASYVTIAIYDLLGREVRRLVQEFKQPGDYQASWDASSVPSGVYFYRLVAGTFVDTKKMMLVK